MARLLQRLESTVTGGAILIATASLLSRVLGLVRARLLFSEFGAGDVLDTYYAAFRLPDLIFNMLVLGALSSAFVPVFVEHWQKEKGDSHRATWDLANSMLTVILAGLLVLGTVAFIFAPQIVPLFAPGFSGDKLSQTVQLTRIMLIAIVFFGVSNVLTSMLNALKRFFAFAFAPIFYNIGIIIGILVFVPTFGVIGLAWGVVLGAALHLLTQLPTVLRMGFRYRWVLDVGRKEVRRIFRLMLPRTVGLGAVQLEQTVSTMIASTLTVGSVAVFSGATDIQSFPVNIFGVSFAVASFPVFSEAFSNKNHAQFVEAFSRVFRRILFFIIPVSVLMLLLRAHIVRLLLGTGKFDWAATLLVAQCLGFFALSLFAQSLMPVIARSFYALQDTKTPVRVSIAGVALNIAGGLILTRFMGVQGLALSFSIASVLQMLVLLALLRHRLGDLDDNRILESALKIIVASGVMALGVWITLQFFALGINSRTFVGILIQGAGAGLVGVILYTCLVVMFRFDEVRLVRQWLIRARNQLFGQNNAKYKIEN